MAVEKSSKSYEEIIAFLQEEIRMTDKGFWRQIEQIASEKQLREPMMPGMARKGFMEVMGKRKMVCFTSKQRAKQCFLLLNGQFPLLVPDSVV